MVLKIVFLFFFKFMTKNEIQAYICWKFSKFYSCFAFRNQLFQPILLNMSMLRFGLALTHNHSGRGQRESQILFYKNFASG